MFGSAAQLDTGARRRRRRNMVVVELEIEAGNGATVGESFATLFGYS